MYSSTLSLTSALEGIGWSTPRPGRFTQGKDPVPIAGGLQGRSGQVRKISPPPRFDHRTAQPVASRRYIDWAIPDWRSCVADDNYTNYIEQARIMTISYISLTSFVFLWRLLTASWVAYKHTETNCDRFTLHLSVSLAAPNKRNLSVANPSGSSFVCKWGEAEHWSC